LRIGPEMIGTGVHALMDRLKQAVPQLGRPTAPLGETLIPVYPIAEALVLLAARNGVTTESSALLAGLPRHNDDLDPKLAPIALARVGLHGEWGSGLSRAQLPCLAPLLNGQAAVVVGLHETGEVELAGPDGIVVVSAQAFAAVSTGKALTVGTADPVNGSAVSDERAAIRKSPKHWILAQFFSNRKLLVQLGTTAALLNLCALILPLYMRSIYDRVVPNLAVESMWALSLGVMIALGFEWAFKGVRSNFVDAVGMRMGQLVQHKVMFGLLNAKLSKAPVQSGSVQMALRDIEGMAILLPNALVTLFVDLPFFIIFCVALYLMGGWVVLAAVLGGVALALSGLVANIGLVRASAKATQLSRARTNLIVDTVEGLAALKAAQAQGRFLRAWDVLSDHAGVNARRVREWIEAPASTAGFVMQTVTVLVIVIGVFQIKAGALTVGGLVACTLLAGRAMVPISTAVTLLSKGYQALSQFAGLSDLLALEGERDQPDEAVRGRAIKGGLTFSDVAFTYPDTSQPALRDVNVVIKPGEKVALIGRSGSGKTTLMQLIAGLHEPSAGVMLLDGFNIGQYGASQLRSAVSYVAQDATLFDLSVRDNILLGQTNVSDAQIDDALRLAAVDQFTSRHPEGLGLKAGARGHRLSGGQRQCVALARAIVRDPRVLVLDEPSSAMDIATEQAVMANLKAYLGDRTLILSTHRLQLLALVDRVIWLDNGKVIADKPRDEVLRMFQGQANDAKVA
jgi:ATP-binding cassette, subfamily C, bacterial LapB